MPITGKFFPSQKTQEKVFLLLRRHWFTYLIFLFITVIMALPLIALAVFWFVYPDYFSGIYGHLFILVAPAYALFILGVLLYGFIDYYLDIYIVTNERIIDIEQNGLFKRGIAELHLHQLQDVSAKVEGFFPTMMHYGNIYIQTAGERENFFFKSIPNPYRVSKLIIDLHEAQLESTIETAEEVMGTKGLETNVLPLAPISSVIELGKDSIEPEEIFQEKGDPQKILSVANQRTKEFLSDQISSDELKERVELEVDSINKKQIMTGFDKAIKKDNERKKDANNEKKDTKVKTVKSKTTKEEKSGELHENEEIDI